MQVYVKWLIDEATEEGRYLASAARIRGVSHAALAKRLLEKIVQDQLVRAVLDDEDCYRKKRA
jgi:hypothetical protein